MAVDLPAGVLNGPAGASHPGFGSLRRTPRLGACRQRADGVPEERPGVAPIGADLTEAVGEFKRHFESRNYRVVEIKVTDVFDFLQRYIEPEQPLDRRDKFNRYITYIKYANQLRSHFNDDAVLAVTTVLSIIRKRLRIQKSDPFSRTAYLIYQFKRKEEIDLLRAIYGRLFFQVSIYSRRGARVDYLSREFAKSRNKPGPSLYRDLAEKIIRDDEDEIEQAHGQRVRKIFHDADFILSLDQRQTISYQIKRICDLIFGSNTISPSHMEYGMFLAKAAALRTLDLSRQVGAAIFSRSGEIITLGSNEVPKATGGTYWSDGEFDDREYVRGHDSNEQRKREILSEIIGIVNPDANIEDILNDGRTQDSQFMDALEYGRIVHAEMSALSDAARLGLPVKDGTLYCTTFPCHMCAKHIIAGGLSKVVFLEPYPKSLAFDLHADALQIEGGDRGKYRDFPAVEFEHFFGVTPRRYTGLFGRGGRKDRKTGKLVSYAGEDGIPEPLMDIKFPFYQALERLTLEEAPDNLPDLEETS